MISKSIKALLILVNDDIKLLKFKCFKLFFPKTSKKLEKNLSKNNLKTNTEKCIENKPVLAWEREARLKE